MKTGFIKVDDHSFNVKDVLTWGTLEKFLTASKTDAHKIGWFENDPERENKLKKVWELCNVKEVTPETGKI